jgi:hypothetical protein
MLIIMDIKMNIYYTVEGKMRIYQFINELEKIPTCVNDRMYSNNTHHTITPSGEINYENAVEDVKLILRD